MPARNKKEPSKIDVLAWALRRLADELYVFEATSDLGGWELYICDSAEEEEIRSSLTQEQAVKIEESFESALSKAFPNADDRVAFVARMAMQKWIQRGRERLGGTEVASLETALLGFNEGIVREEVASLYLKEFAREFEKLVRRAEELRVLDTSAPVPEQVQTYLAEATRCYIYGRYIACLLVCRSAIEVALRDRLKRQDSIEKLISYGREMLPWTLKPTLDLAHEVRVAANQAVHPGPGAVPPAEICKDMFVKTRGVLRELYSEQDPLGLLGRASTS
jgi:hypothetical protein